MIIKLQDISTDWAAKLNKAEQEYDYQPNLTAKLDNYSDNFTETTLLEIVLWKTNRYPNINQDIINSINSLRKEYSDTKAKNLLRELLELKGFDLPMASTILRFALPDKFQIIDQRVYRFITPGEDQFKRLHNTQAKIDLYFDYLKRLTAICKDYGIPFSKADRILYQLDKTENKNIPIKY